MAESSSETPPRILFVCLGNICRSPTAHGVLRAMARKQGRTLEIDSAGTGNWHLGSPPDPRSSAAALARGIDISDLYARQVTAADFDRFDLILAMDEANRRDLERLRPPGNATPVQLLLEHAPGPAREVPDPYLGGGFNAVLDLIETASEGLLATLDKR